MARQLRLKPVEQGRQRIRAWTSFRSQRRDAQEAKHRNQIQYHHRRSGRQGSPGGQCSCQQAYGFCRGQDLQFPFR